MAKYCFGKLLTTAENSFVLEKTLRLPRENILEIRSEVSRVGLYYPDPSKSNRVFRRPNMISIAQDPSNHLGALADSKHTNPIDIDLLPFFFGNTNVYIEEYLRNPRQAQLDVLAKLENYNKEFAKLPPESSSLITELVDSSFPGVKLLLSEFLPLIISDDNVCNTRKYSITETERYVQSGSNQGYIIDPTAEDILNMVSADNALSEINARVLALNPITKD